MVFDCRFSLKILILFLNIFIKNFSFSQNSIDYSINASLLTETDQLIIKQKINIIYLKVNLYLMDTLVVKEIHSSLTNLYARSKATRSIRSSTCVGASGVARTAAGSRARTLGRTPPRGASAA